MTQTPSLANPPVQMTTPMDPPLIPVTIFRTCTKWFLVLWWHNLKKLNTDLLWSVSTVVMYWCAAMSEVTGWWLGPIVQLGLYFLDSLQCMFPKSKLPGVPGWIVSLPKSGSVCVCLKVYGRHVPQIFVKSSTTGGHFQRSVVCNTKHHPKNTRVKFSKCRTHQFLKY